nr:TraX family protein [uncultured Blautia sp.]
MNREQIKYIAMFTMLLNHIANIFLKSDTLLFQVLVDVGYFTAITMCYFLVEGYSYTHSKEKYGKRLLLFAVFSELPFCLAFTEEGIIRFVNMNMLFTLFLCFLILYAMEKIPSGKYQTLCILGLVFLSVYSDWALLAPVFTYWFASCGAVGLQGKMFSAGERNKRLWSVFGKAMLFFGILNLIENLETTTPVIGILQSLGAVSGILFSGLCIIYLYNGKRSRKHPAFSKWFFYIFYPAHLLVLGILRLAI